MTYGIMITPSGLIIFCYHHCHCPSHHRHHHCRYPSSTSSVSSRSVINTFLRQAVSTIHYRSESVVLVRRRNVPFSSVCVLPEPASLNDEERGWRLIESWMKRKHLECPYSEYLPLSHCAKTRTSKALFDTLTPGLVHILGGRIFI